MSNPLYPNLNTPAIHSCIARADTGTQLSEELTETALKELSDLKASVKACKEQMERSSNALTEVSNARMKLVDKLCDIRDTLKVAVQDTTSFASDRRQEAIQAILKKHFGLWT